MGVRGIRLRQLRELRGFTQEELAERIGVAPLQIYRWETEKRDPSADFIARLARVLETSSDYLVGIDDDPIKQYKETDLTPDERRLVDAYRTGRIWEIISLLDEKAPANVGGESQIASSEPAVDS